MGHTKQINRVIDHITHHLDQALTVETLADIAGLSKYHFHRVFREETGETVDKFIARKRLEKAGRELCRPTDTPIADISYAVGYSSPALFCRKFKTHFGMTATEYRSKQREQNSNHSQSPRTQEEYVSVLTRYLRGDKSIKIGDKTMNCSFEIKQIAPKQVIYYRHVGPYDKMGPSIGKLMQWAYPRGLVKNPPLIGANYLDDPDITPPDKLQSDVFLVVDQDVRVEGEIGKYTIDGGQYAVGRFEIAISEFGDAWHAMCRLVTEHGCQSIDGCHHELYLNNPDEHPEKKHLVDIYIPVKPL